MTAVTVIASRPHYLAHLLPLWRALGAPGAVAIDRALSGGVEGIGVPWRPLWRGSGPALVAGWFDLQRARRLGFGPFVLAQHGAGQSYHGDRRSAGNPAYAGGRVGDDVRLFIVPGPDPEYRWQQSHPGVPVVRTGNLTPLPGRVGEPDGTVAVTFHWACSLIPETGSAWREFHRGLAALARHRRVLGHWHPRWGDALRKAYVTAGVEPVATLAEVARRADVLVADNTSAMYEFAATGRPVVVMDPGRYRRSVDHGLRFWAAASVGPSVGEAGDLGDAVTYALRDLGPDRRARARAVGLVYDGDGPDAAAAAIRAIM